MENIVTFKTNKDGHPFGLSLEIPKGDSFSRSSFELLLTTHTAKDTNVTIKVDASNGSFTIQNLLSLTSVEACLAGCAVATLVGPLISCFSTDIQKYKECLKSEGLDMLSDAVKCAIGCAASMAGTP
jgi:hypothetical protein